MTQPSQAPIHRGRHPSVANRRTPPRRPGWPTHRAGQDDIAASVFRRSPIAPGRSRACTRWAAACPGPSGLRERIPGGGPAEFNIAGLPVEVGENRPRLT